MSILLAVVLVLAPLAMTPAWELYFDVTPKVALIILGAAAALMLEAPGFAGKWRAHRELRWLAALFTFALASLAVSTALSADPSLSLAGSVWRRSGLITQAALLIFTLVTAAHLAGDFAAQERTLRLMSVAVLPVACYGIVQYFGWDPFLPAAAYHVGEGVWTIVRPPATLGHAGYFANFLLPCAFAGFGLQWLDARRSWRVLGGVTAALCVAAIVLSGTRAATLALVAGGIYAAVSRPPRLTRRFAGLLVLAIAGGAVFYASPVGMQLRARVRWSVEDAHGGPRLLLWRDSLRMSGMRWAAGWGPETFSTVFPRYQSRALSRAYPDFYHESPHNIYLDAMVRQGMPGLMVWVGLTAFGFVAARKLHRRDPARAGILGGAWLASLIGHQFEVFTVAPELYSLLILALLAAAGEASEPAAAPVRGVRLAIAPLSLVLVAFAVLLVAADRLEFESSAMLGRAHIVEASQLHEQARATGLADDLWFARRSAALSAKPADPMTRVLASQEAMNAAERACRRSEARQNACYLLAALFASRNAPSRTEASLRRAIAASPTWFKPHWMLARVLALRGKNAEAREEAKLATELDGGRDAEVTATLAHLAKR